ncbi:FAD-dependent monooxygenase [Mumia sp. ZJ430]|uniref:FAD-dependent monooxygenase n=1 Tax=Mumia sp. ZJ430 TaxID=2708083 RepID=UPI00141D859E|nr:FAD-dependent monooxygenase [Mumia sp. ZJ430]
MAAIETGRQVLVAGGGIAGFGMARALTAHGLTCTVAESSPAPAPAGLAMNLPANAARALDALGLDGAVVRAGRPIRRREYRSQRGRLLFAVDEEAFWGDVGTSVCIRRESLLGLLRDGLDERQVRWGTRVAAVVPDGDVVTIRTEGEAADEETYDYVVGADGIHSNVRRAVTGDALLEPATMGAAGWRFLAPNPALTCWTAWTGKHGTILLIPLSDDLVYGFASTTHGGPAAADPEWLTTTFASFPEPVAVTVAHAATSVDQLYHSRVDEVRADRWSSGHVTVIGDAAHAMAPVWAQGAALALEDGLVLAELLATTRDWSQVGTAFEQRRRSRVAHVRAATERLAHVAQLPLWVRDVVAPTIGPRTYRAAYELLRDHLP